MEYTQPAHSSKWHKPVPKAVSNAAMVAMVTLCYFGLVSPTLELVQTASLVQANTMLRYNSDFGVQVTIPEDKQGIAALRELAILTVNTTTNQKTSVALIEQDIGKLQLSYVNISPVSSIQVSGPNGDPFTAGENSIIENTLPTVSPTVYKPSANLSPSNPSSPDVDGWEPVVTGLSEEEKVEIENKISELTALSEQGASMLSNSKLTSDQLVKVAENLRFILSETNALLEQLSSSYVSAPAAGRPGEGESPVSAPLLLSTPPASSPKGSVSAPPTTPVENPPVVPPKTQALKPSAGELDNL